ncbi:methyltransferase, putative [Bodo saltans]|uniref:Methyltransferase, putative n=1 Tax=Bodo saltans TaxID=75058 RepID=A0A0S4JI76_BODSA|nr:methyltransferase, putative [Bodo saltans]|eukprot:CUG89852.1 methyltransferase, putative [Bodo saltans]
MDTDHEDAKQLASSSPTISSGVSAALLITGIPLQSKGKYLGQTLRAYFAQAAAAITEEGTPSWKAPQIKFSFTIHGHIRGGTCIALFSSAEEAERCACVVVDQRHDETTIGPCIYDGKSLQFDRCAGKMRDHLFPSLPYHARREMLLDPESTFSVTCEVDAFRMASLLRLFHDAVCRSTHTTTGGAQSTSETPKDAASLTTVAAMATVVDAMACVGGNTRAFLYYFQRVIAVECDAARFHYLRKNMARAVNLCQVVDTDNDSDADLHLTGLQEVFSTVLSSTSMKFHTAVRNRLSALYPAVGDSLTLLQSSDQRSNFVFAPVVSELAFKNVDVLASLLGNGGNSVTSSASRRSNKILECATDTEDNAVMFFDPPWGGTNYVEVLKEHHGDLPLSLLPRLLAANTDFSSSFLLTCDAPRTVKDWICQLCGCEPLQTSTSSEAAASLLLLPVAPVIVWKLPAAMDLTDIAQRLTAHPPHRRQQSSNSGATLERQRRERNFPFRFHFGAHTQLLVVAVAGNVTRGTATTTIQAGGGFSDAPSRKDDDGHGQEDVLLWFHNSRLDLLVSQIQAWHQSIGRHECRPEMYDYDKKRWIVLKKWIPTKGTVAAVVQGGVVAPLS